jgi:hypothetical protein
MFLAFPAHHEELNDCSGSLWFYLRIVVMDVLLFVFGPAGPTTNTVRPEGLCQSKIPMKPSVMEPATFRLLKQCLNQLRYHVPP